MRRMAWVGILRAAPAAGLGAAALLGFIPSVAFAWGASARIRADAIDECSGIARSRQHAGVFWVHNDSGDSARFFAIDARGALLAEYALDGARNVDWEDLTVDDAGRLYFGDFGNNRNKRRDLVVYVCAEPAPPTHAGPVLHVPLVARLPFRYPDQAAFPDSAHFNFDCEAMFWNAGKLYLLTKHRSDIRTTLYRLDPAQENREQVVERLGECDIGSPVTAADCTPDGKLVAVLSYQYIHLFDAPPQGDNFLAGRAHATLIEGRQCEGLCFDRDRIVFTNEQSEIYRVPTRRLRASDRYLPRAPEARVPQVEPCLDGVPSEWRGRAGRLAFDAALTEEAVPGRAAARRRAALLDSVQVRVGWTARGLLLYARWQPPTAEAAEGPVLFVMTGPPPGAEPCRQPEQRAWSAGWSDGRLQLAPAAQEPDIRPCAGDSAVAVVESRSVMRLAGRGVELEALLPCLSSDSLSLGQARALNVVLIDRRAPEAPVAWSAALDMQPLGNPLLWGRLVLEGPQGPGARR